MQRIDHAEQFFRNTGAVIQHGGNQAFYRVTVRIRAKLGNKPKSYFDDTRMKPISMYGKTLASSLRMAYQSDMVLRISFRAIWSAIAVL
jgi:antirestriction protein ArdC